MNPNHIPGNEPDADDMWTEPGIGMPDEPTDHGLPDDEAKTSGGFA